jgi:TolB-like protein/DNA-binding winged helix-turn-helix (wHTH) protein
VAQVFSDHTFRFGEGFELDPGAYDLRHSGQSLKLERIPMELLLLLVEQRGQLVTRSQIVERIWGNDVFVDTANGINVAIRKLRQALQDDPDHPRFIETVMGRGYRFVAPVEIIKGSAPQRSSQDKPARNLPEQFRLPGEDRTAANRKRLSLLALSLALLGALGIYFTWSRAHARSQPPAGPVMLAVLPFENLTGDQRQDYFSDGLTEELITQVGRVDPRQISVIARTSMMRYKHSPKPPDQVGRELGAQYVLKGNVERTADRVRIKTELAGVQAGTPSWVHEYDAGIDELPALQENIAAQVVQQVETAFGTQKLPSKYIRAALAPELVEAYDLYLKGQYYWNQRTPEGLQKAVDYFLQATAKDPKYARAYASLATSYALLSEYKASPASQYMPKAHAAALRALEIDEYLPEAHAALALVVENYDWDWQTAEKEFRAAIELDPNYATAHQWYAEHLAWQGRFNEAFAEIERARQLDPLSLIIAADNGAILYFSRQYSRAIEQCKAVLNTEPGFPRAHILVFAYAQEGKYDAALADLDALRRTGILPGNSTMLAYIYGRSGEMTKAKEALDALEKANRKEPLDPAMFAIAHIGMNNPDQAMAYLQAAYDQHSNTMTTLKVDPIYDPLRRDPRFQDLLRRVGFSN